MGRLSEFDEDERAVIQALQARCCCHRGEYGVCPVHGLQDPTADRLNREAVEASDAQLGKKVRELLASEEPPITLRMSLDEVASGDGLDVSDGGATAAWAWFRELGNQPGTLTTGGVTGARDGR